MKDLFTIKIKDKEYVHIDTISYKNQVLYHFGSLDDEIFCLKQGMEYIPIQHSFQLAIIKNKLGLINTHYIYDIDQEINGIYSIIDGWDLKLQYHLENLKNIIFYADSNIKIVQENERYKIIQEQIENFKGIKEKFNLDINIQDIFRKIVSVQLIKKDILNRGKASGYYNPGRHIIALEDKNDINDSSNNWYKRVRLHEHIHSCTGAKCLLYSLGRMSGFLEGETENLVEDYMGEEESGFDYFERGDKADTIQYNFSQGASYKPQVSIIKQMEYVLGKKSYKSILNGNMEFETEFAKKYGMPLMIFLAHRTRMLIAGRKLNKRFKNIKPFNEVKYFKNTQNLLMKKVFDKDFEEINDIEDAKTYFEKLREFETMRGRIRYNDISIDDRVEDNSFKKYYDKKYGEIVDKLQSKGFEKSEIKSAIEQYKYNRQLFKPFRTKEEEFEVVKNIIISDIAQYCIRAKSVNVDNNNLEFNYFRILENSYQIFVRNDKKNEKFSYGAVLTDNIMDVKKAIKQIESKENEDSEELEQDLKKAGYKEEKIEFTEEEFKQRLFDEFRRIDDNLYEESFSLAMHSEENYEERKKKIDKMQQKRMTIKNFFEVEHKTEKEEVVEHKSEKEEKVDRVKELINLSKEQDMEIVQLESQLVQKGMTIDE